MSTEKNVLGSQATVLSTGATLANNAQAISALYDNTVGGGGGDGYSRCRLTLNATWASAPTANTGVSGWFVTSEDAGSSYEDGDASVQPARPPDFTFPVRAVTTAQQVARTAQLPTGKLKVLVRNDATGQTISSGWTVKLLPVTPSFV